MLLCIINLSYIPRWHVQDAADAAYRKDKTEGQLLNEGSFAQEK